MTLNLDKKFCQIWHLFWDKKISKSLCGFKKKKLSQTIQNSLTTSIQYTLSRLIFYIGLFRV